MRATRFFLVLAFLFSLTTLGARAADLRYYLTPPALSGARGDLLTFSGHLENTSASELFLNGSLLELSGSGLSANDDPFIFNAPFSLAPAGSIDGLGTLTDRWDGDLFTVKIDPTAAPGNYYGFFRIRGGSTDSASDELGVQDFQVTVTPAVVPELNSTAILATLTGLSAGLMWRRRLRSA